MDKAKVNYSQVNIIQVSDLKNQLEEIGIKIYEVKKLWNDAINMYPSIKLATIKKLVFFISKWLTYLENKTILLCLKTIRFRMSSALIYFYGIYCEYHGGWNKQQG